MHYLYSTLRDVVTKNACHAEYFVYLSDTKQQ